MSSTPMSLSTSNFVEVNVTVAAGAVAARQFNQGLIVGPSAVIPTYGANARLQQFASLNAMLESGFTDTEPEYLAAELYFGQDEPVPFVWIGRQNLTAIQTAIPHAGNAGTGYVVGDQIAVVQGGASHGLLNVLTVSAGGVVVTLGTTIGNQGTGYTVATGLATTGGTGTGLEVDITVAGETYLQAVQACALVNNASWYGVMCCNATDADHLAIGAYSNANWESLLYFGSTATAAVPAGTAGNIALQLQALGYKMYLSYNTTQGGEYPSNAYAAAGIIGLYCGLDTGGPNSAFTLNLKQVSGVAAEPLTQAQYNAIIGADGNVVATFGPYSNYIAQGVLSSGDYFDSVLFRATLVALITTNLMNLLVSVPKIPQTDPGESQLIGQVIDACTTMAAVGYIGPGVWTGPDILDLSTGQAMPLGYVVQAPSFSTQSPGNKAARQAMPISCCINEAGAVQSCIVNVYVEI